MQAKTLLVPKTLLAYKELDYSTLPDHAGKPASTAPFCFNSINMLVH